MTGNIPATVENSFMFEAQIDGKQTSVPQDKVGAKTSKESYKYIQALNNLKNKFPLHDTNK